jgi:preprotein translocase subunit SecY
MPFCTNPNCPHKEKTGSFAEYRDGITHCPECDSPLTDNPINLPGNVEKMDSDLTRKILITIGLLVLYRLLCLIPLPGVDLSGLPDNLFVRYFHSSRISMGALGIMPYISAYIFVEVFSLIIPPLKRWRGEKQEGRRKLTVTARWLTLIICLVQGYGLAMGLVRMALPDGSLATSSSGMGFRLIVVITLTACVFINLWIADQITSRGIGNGISMLIFTAVAINMFSNLMTSFNNTLARGDLMEGIVTFIFMLLILFAAGPFILFMERGEYNIKVKLKNNSLVDLPFKYNTAGIVPATLTASIVMIPVTLMQFSSSYPKFYEYFQYGSWTYFIAFTIMTTVLFFLFASLYYNPDKILSFLRSNNAEPVLPDGVFFEKLLDKKLTILTIWGAIYLFVFSVLFSPAIHIYIVISGLVLIRVVSISLDIINDVKARNKYGYFVKIDEFQKPYEAKFIKNILDMNNIPCFLEGYYHRSLLYFFGPFIEISLYAQRDKESEAMNILSELKGETLSTTE